MELLDKEDRSKLGEGRSYQMGFAFCKKVKEGQFKTVQPLSPCKDYLNDVVYSEATDKPVHAFGLSYKKENIYDKDKAYMVIRIMKNFGGDKYNGFDNDVANLKSNWKNLQSFINHFEEKQGMKERTRIIPLKDKLDTFMVEVPLFWCQATYLISLYTLLLRTGQFFKGDKTPDEYVADFKEFAPDIYLLNSAKPKLEKVLKGEFPKQNFSNFRGGTDVHNHGICAAHF